MCVHVYIYIILINTWGLPVEPLRVSLRAFPVCTGVLSYCIIQSIRSYILSYSFEDSVILLYALVYYFVLHIMVAENISSAASHQCH